MPKPVRFCCTFRNLPEMRQTTMHQLARLSIYSSNSVNVFETIVSDRCSRSGLDVEVEIQKLQARSRLCRCGDRALRRPPASTAPVCQAVTTHLPQQTALLHGIRRSTNIQRSLRVAFILQRLRAKLVSACCFQPSSLLASSPLLCCSWVEICSRVLNVRLSHHHMHPSACQCSPALC